MEMLPHSQSTNSLFVGALKLRRHVVHVGGLEDPAILSSFTKALLPPAGNLCDDTRPEFGSSSIPGGIVIFFHRTGSGRLAPSDLAMVLLPFRSSTMRSLQTVVISNFVDDRVGWTLNQTCATTNTDFRVSENHLVLLCRSKTFNRADQIADFAPNTLFLNYGEPQVTGAVKELGVATRPQRGIAGKSRARQEGGECKEHCPFNDEKSSRMPRGNYGAD